MFSAILPPNYEMARKQGSKSSATAAATDLGNDMILLDAFLSVDECRAWISWGENYHNEEKDTTATGMTGFVSCSQEATNEYAFRRQGRLEIDSADIANSIFTRLSLCNAIPATMEGLVPHSCMKNIRLYKYAQGDAFGKHIDESHQTSPGCFSEFTCLIYLNGDGYNTMKSFREYDENGLCGVMGGATAFYTSHSSMLPFVTVAPQVGRCLLHAHGHRCLTHEAQPVLEGTKYVLRTDVVYSIGTQKKEMKTTTKKKKKKKEK